MLQIFFENIWIVLVVIFVVGFVIVIGSLLVLFLCWFSLCLLVFGLVFVGGVMVYVLLLEIFNKFIVLFVLVYGECIGFIYGILVFLLGVIVIVLIDYFIFNLYDSLDKQDFVFCENSCEYLKWVVLLILVVIIVYNFLEGLVIFFVMLESLLVGMLLVFVIVIYNIFEGIVIVVLVYFVIQNKVYVFSVSLLLGLVELVGVVFGYWLLFGLLLYVIFGWVFGLIVGVMVFLVLDELLLVVKCYVKGYEIVYGLVVGMGMLVISLVLFKW